MIIYVIVGKKCLLASPPIKTIDNISYAQSTMANNNPTKVEKSNNQENGNTKFPYGKSFEKGKNGGHQAGIH